MPHVKVSHNEGLSLQLARQNCDAPARSYQRQQQTDIYGGFYSHHDNGLFLFGVKSAVPTVSPRFNRNVPPCGSTLCAVLHQNTAVVSKTEKQGSGDSTLAYSRNQRF